MCQLLSVDPNQITILDSHRFTLFCNALLRAEASRCSIPQVAVDTTVNDTDPDGGIDARISPPTPFSSPPGEAWLPPGQSGWQFKSGKCPSANALAAEEFSKSGVHAALASGLSYRFLTADAISDKKRLEIEAKLRAFGSEIGVAIACPCVFTATRLAKWAEQHLAVAQAFFNLPIDGIQPFETWAEHPRFKNAFFPDQARTDLVADIRNRLRSGSDDRTVRLAGRAGDGKTRLVLEAVDISGIKERVLYASDASQVSANFFAYLTHHVASGSAVLVLDEFTRALDQKLSYLLEGLPPGFSTITIGPSEYPEMGTDSYNLGGLPVPELAQILDSLVPGLPEVERTEIAKRCGGSPKLAVFIGQARARDLGGALSWRDLESTDVLHFLDRLLPLTGPAADLPVMSTLCLFSRIGWWEELQNEGQALMDAFDIPWDQAQASVASLQDRGVISTRGRYLYPTPDVLANHLARRSLEQHRNSIIETLAALPHPMKTSFAERLRQLGDDPSTVALARKIFGEAFFFDLRSLGNSTDARFFRLLASAAPGMALAILNNTIATASREDLLAFSNGRRDVVWALEEIVWWPEHFALAARILLRLAWAENESYGNNARGIWTQLFQVVLGGTGAPFDERFALLKGVLGDQDAIMRRLGLDALKAALQFDQISRTGGPPAGGGQLPPPEWAPATHGEWFDIIRQCLAALRPLLKDPDAETRVMAATVLAGSLGVIEQHAESAWFAAARDLSGQPYSVRKPVLEAIERYSQHADWFSPSLRQSLNDLGNELLGTAFGDRLHKALGAWVGTEVSPETHALAEEAIGDAPLLKGEAPFLTSGEAGSVFFFGMELGRLDRQDVHLDWIVALHLPSIADDRFLVGYLFGARERHGDLWLQGKLEEWALEPATARLAASVTVASSMPGSAERLAALLEIGRFDDRFATYLLRAIRVHDAPPEAVASLLTTSRRLYPALAQARLTLLAQYVHSHTELLPPIAGLAVETLAEAASVVGNLDSYRWAAVARSVVGCHPLEVARTVMTVAASGPLGDEVLDVLARASASPAGGFEVFSEVVIPALFASPVLLMRFTAFVKKGPLLEAFPADQVVGWIEGDLEPRLKLVRQLVPVSGTLEPLTRALLIRFGDRTDVRETLRASFISGIFAGPHSARLKSKLRELEPLLSDQSPAVNQWASETAQAIKSDIENTMKLEEEEELES